MYQARLVMGILFALFAAVWAAFGVGVWGVVFGGVMAVTHVALAVWDYSNRNKNS